MTNMTTKWTDETEQKLRELAPDHTVKELAFLFNKTYTAMYQTCARLNVTPKKGPRGPGSGAVNPDLVPVVEVNTKELGRPWTLEDDEELKAVSSSYTCVELAELLQRTVKSIQHRCHKLGASFIDRRGSGLRKESGLPREYKPGSNVKAWTEEDLDLLKALSPTLSVAKLAERLGRTEGSIRWAVREYDCETRGRTWVRTDEDLLRQSISIAEGHKEKVEAKWKEIEEAGVRNCSGCREDRTLDEYYFDSRVQRPIAKCKWCVRSKKFGITANELKSLYEEQNWKCGLCKETEIRISDQGMSHALSVDHEHSCCKHGCRKCIRGILCNECNQGLGKFDKKPKTRMLFSAYLNRRPLLDRIQND